MEHILKNLDESAPAQAPKTGRIKRVLAGVALTALGVLLLGAALWATDDRALRHSGLNKLIALAALLPLKFGLDMISPGLSKKVMDWLDKHLLRR